MTIEESNKEYMDHLREKLSPYMLFDPQPCTMEDLRMPTPLTPQTAQAVVEYALANGLLTQDQISEAISKQPTAEMMRIATLLHQVSCGKLHEPNDEDFHCRFYEEEACVDSNCMIWQKSEHAWWLTRAVGFMKAINASTEDEFVRVFRQTQGILSYLQEKKNSLPTAYALMLLIRGWED